MLAVLAARSHWRAAGGQGRPVVVVPVTGHAAFAKAAHVLDMDLRTLPVDPVTMRVRVEDVAAALDEVGQAAALVVVSSPSYAHGVVDPVAEVAALAAARGVACHSDACIGGLVLPYLRRSGRAMAGRSLWSQGVVLAIVGAEFLVKRLQFDCEGRAMLMARSWRCGVCACGYCKRCRLA